MRSTLDEAARIATALHDVHDFQSLVENLLVGGLDRPIDVRGVEAEALAYEWSDDELRMTTQRHGLVGGRALQLVLPGNPWGIFVLEFEDEAALRPDRGMTGLLRSALGGLVRRKRASGASSLPSFKREHLLFICTSRYRSFRFAYFDAPATDPSRTVLKSFGWDADDGSAVRTVCEHNLPELRWPTEMPSESGWADRWGAAFDMERVTKKFYDDYAAAFHDAERLISEVAPVDDADLRLFTQTLFNRLMFLRFLERKGWLRFPGQDSSRYLHALFQAGTVQGASFYRSRLRPLFTEGLAKTGNESSEAYGQVPFLNGGLFDQTRLDDLVLDVPDAAFSPIIGEDGLFYRYNFTVEESTPFDIDVAIDPEMLGLVFEELVTGRHASGSYYTPREVVSYMCRRVLARYLSEAIGMSDAEMWSFVEGDDSDVLDPSAAVAASEALDRMRALDPACGSGAYLLGMLQEIVGLHVRLDRSLPSNEVRSIGDIKSRVVLKNLHGADVDPFATEIAKLRLWLTLAIDADEATPLPNLDFRIATGDSLGPMSRLGMGLFDQSLQSRGQRLQAWKDSYFSKHGRDKARLRVQITAEEDAISQELESLLGPGVIDWRVHFADVFAEDGGFDVVLANPPYVSAIEFKRRHGDKRRSELRNLFVTARGAWDFYIPFFERGIELLRDGGLLAYISPNKYLSASYAQALRGYIRASCEFQQLVDLSSIPVFRSASVYPVLTFLQRTTASGDDIKCRLPPDREAESPDPRSFDESHAPQASLDLLPENLWGFLLSNRLDTLMGVLPHTDPLGGLASVSATTTAAEAAEYQPLVAEDDGAGYFRVLITGTIDPFTSLWGEKPMRAKGKKYLRPTLAAEAVSDRRRQLYGTPKLLVAKLTGSCEAFLDDGGRYAGLNLNCVYAPRPGVSLDFLCEYLNSRLFMFFYDQFFGALRMAGGAYQFQAPQLRVIPVPRASSEQQEAIVAAGRQVRSAIDRQAGQTELDDLIGQLDRLLASLVGLGRSPSVGHEHE